MNFKWIRRISTTIIAFDCRIFITCKLEVTQSGPGSWGNDFFVKMLLWSKTIFSLFKKFNKVRSVEDGKYYSYYPANLE